MEPPMSNREIALYQSIEVSKTTVNPESLDLILKRADKFLEYLSKEDRVLTEEDVIVLDIVKDLREQAGTQPNVHSKLLDLGLG